MRCNDNALETLRQAHRLLLADMVGLIEAWASEGIPLPDGSGRRLIAADGREVAVALTRTGNLKTTFSDQRTRDSVVAFVRDSLDAGMDHVFHQLVMCGREIEGGFVCDDFRFAPVRFNEEDLRGFPEPPAPLTVPPARGVPLHLQLNVVSPPLEIVQGWGIALMSRRITRLSGFLACHLDRWIWPIESGETWAVQQRPAPRNLLVMQGYHAIENGLTDKWVGEPPRPLPRIDTRVSPDYFDLIAGPAGVPDDLADRWRRLSQLPLDDLPALDRAFTWVLRAVGAFQRYDHALALVSAVVSIECLVQSGASTPRRCKDCGQSVYQLNSRFKDFLEEFVTPETPLLARVFDRLYDRRSGIVHGSFVDMLDGTPFAAFDDSNIYIEAMAGIVAARRAVRNWLARPVAD